MSTSVQMGAGSLRSFVADTFAGAGCTCEESARSEPSANARARVSPSCAKFLRARSRAAETWAAISATAISAGLDNKRIERALFGNA
ncbi:MAG TPA: hypothetical protein VEU47_17705 [Candidatus Cybelea sp.]|nr:hypothetical protein [Candidatus Cybelea sp.]